MGKKLNTGRAFEQTQVRPAGNELSPGFGRAHPKCGTVVASWLGIHGARGKDIASGSPPAPQLFD